MVTTNLAITGICALFSRPYQSVADERMRRMRNILFLVLVPTVLMACGDDEPINKPTVIDAQARCRQVEMVPKLVSVDIRVQDLDGISDLQTPIVVVDSTRLEMGDVAPAGGDPVPGCKDPDGQCVGIFSWTRGRDTAQLYCGSGLNELELEVRVLDEAGFKEDIFIIAQPDS